MILLTVKEVARQLKISLSLAYRLIASGEIPCYEIGTCKRVSEADLAAYLETRKKQTQRLPRRKRRHF